jgi:hypothetical protein
MNRLDDDAQLKSIFQFNAGEPEQAGRVTCCGMMALTDPFTMDVLRSYDTCSLNQTSATSRKTDPRPSYPVLEQPIRVCEAIGVMDDDYKSLISWGKDNIILAHATGTDIHLFKQYTHRRIQLTCGCVYD